MGAGKIPPKHPKVGTSYNQFGYPPEAKAKKPVKRQDLHVNSVYCPFVQTTNATKKLNSVFCASPS